MSVGELILADAHSISEAVRTGQASAREIVDAALSRVAIRDATINSFTDVLVERARAKADALDHKRATRQKLGPLAGVPFAVKNLFDIAGLPTRAGSKINRASAIAQDDAALIQRLEAADAILIGALNMGEYAYDFTGENVHDGPSRNPHDTRHMSGGSSGGSAAAVAAGFVPLSLGSDTNGSIRVPSALCGVFGLKPTFGRLARTGSFPFVPTLDHIGPFARSVRDLAAAYDAMQGPDHADPAATERPIEPVQARLEDDISGLRIATAVGHFAKNGEADAFEAVAAIARALGARRAVELPEAARARAAAYLLTAAEAAALHLDRLRARARDFDPAVRDRLLAGAAIPAWWISKAQRFRRWFHERVMELFETTDVILAPATPCRAPRIGQITFTIDGVTLPVRPNLGVFTQPISFIGLPVATVPLWLDAGLPLGVQIVGAPWREDVVLRVARALERMGVVRAPVAKLED
jgi:aspartyl-tRNA(Asn)/glutamyl-tRNA(Gln) amidotransferase subunit A